MNNKIIKFLSSIPIILVMLYFIPFIGICLILLRYFVSDQKKRTSTPIIITIIGLIILIPKGISLILKTLSIKVSTIPYLSTILNSELYNKDFISYSKYLISVGIIFLIISYVTKSIFDKVTSKLQTSISSYIKESEKRKDAILQKNDLIMKENKEKANNTSYVKCPSCGADNLITGKTGRCKHCRSTLVNEKYK